MRTTLQTYQGYSLTSGIDGFYNLYLGEDKVFMVHADQLSDADSPAHRESIAVMIFEAETIDLTDEEYKEFINRNS